MKIGVTGSVGFLGANLVKYLHERRDRSFEVVCFYSSRRSNPLTEALELPSVHLDVMSPDAVLKKTADLDVLFHLAGVVDYSRKNSRRTWDVNVLGARNIFEAALRNRLSRLIFISSINVLGTAGRGGEPADESNPIYGTPGNPISFEDREQALEAVRASVRGDRSFLTRSRVPYFDAKLASYELATEYYREHGVPVTVVLPGTAVGAGDVGLSITRLVYLTYSGKLKLTLPGMTSFVSAPDVAEGIWLSYLRGESGQAYLITGYPEDNLSYRQFMKRVTEVARSRYHRRVSDRFIEVPAALCRPLAGLLRHLPPGGLSEALVLSGTAVHRFSSAKAESHLGYRPKIPLPQAIASCLEFYLHQTPRALR